MSSGDNMLNVNVEWECGARAVTLCMPISCAKALDVTQWDSARLGSCVRAVRMLSVQSLFCRRFLSAGCLDGCLQASLSSRGGALGKSTVMFVGRGTDSVHVQKRAG